MKPLTQAVQGTLYQKGDQQVLLLDDTAPPLFLRYALVVQGSEEHIFPAFVLDDWGGEKDTLALYDWIYAEGQRFPRAEVFGFEEDGRDTQCFLRELEIYFEFPVYVYPDAESSVTDGVLLHYILVADETHSGPPDKIERPEDVEAPIPRARVRWWRVHPDRLSEYGFLIYTF